MLLLSFKSIKNNQLTLTTITMNLKLVLTLTIAFLALGKVENFKLLQQGNYMYSAYMNLCCSPDFESYVFRLHDSTVQLI